MFKEERQQGILKILNDKTFVSVNRLSQMLFISLPTVRRDLAELERQGLVVRNHGGAMRLGEGAYKIPLQFRSNHKMSQKQELCRNAARLVENGNVIFIDASTSAMHIADYITAQDVTVVTNGLPVATLLAERGIKTILAGGEVAENSLGCVGSDTEEFIKGFNFNLVFFSSYGVNDDGMIVDTSREEIGVRRAAFKSCERKVFLYTSDKEHLKAPFNLLTLKEVEVVIGE